MIECALNKNTIENKHSNMSFAALLKECNEKILKEKEKLYNFKFSSDFEDVLTNNKIDEPLEKFKEKEEDKDIESKKICSENVKNQIRNVKQTSHVPNIFKERVKLFLKNKNLL